MKKRKKADRVISVFIFNGFYETSQIKDKDKKSQFSWL